MPGDLLRPRPVLFHRSTRWNIARRQFHVWYQRLAAPPPAAGGSLPPAAAACPRARKIRPPGGGDRRRRGPAAATSGAESSFPKSCRSSYHTIMV